MELGHNTTLLLDEILKNYDKRLRPGFGGNTSRNATLKRSNKIPHKSY